MSFSNTKEEENMYSLKIIYMLRNMQKVKIAEEKNRKLPILAKWGGGHPPIGKRPIYFFFSFEGFPYQFKTEADII